jgi:hypothetical protein
MSNGGAAAAAAVIQAIRASGVLVEVEPEDFLTIVGRSESPLVVVAEPRWYSPRFKYLASHKGLAFYTKSRVPLDLPRRADIVAARSIWTP